MSIYYVFRLTLEVGKKGVIMKNLVNLTPYVITVCKTDGTIIRSIPASGRLARVACDTVQYSQLEDIPLTVSVYGEVVGLPDPEENTVYIVSSLVASRVPEREDVFIPSGSVRDSEGRIIRCTSLGHV